MGFPGTQGCKISQVIMLVKSWPYPEFFFKSMILILKQLIIKNLLWFFLLICHRFAYILRTRFNISGLTSDITCVDHSK